ISAWSITAFTVERYIAICHAIKAQLLCTVSRAKRIISSLWLFTSLYCLMWFFLVDTTQVTFSDGAQGKVQGGYSPHITPSTWIHGTPHQLGFSKGRREAQKGPEWSSPGEVHLNSKKPSCNGQVTKMLAVVVVLFALLWMPYRTLVVVNSFMDPPYLNIWFLLFCRMCIYLNSAINPIIYNLMSQKFRAAFRKLWNCEEKSAENPAPYTTPVYYSVTKDHPHDSSD
ncbi:Thyrotropin-releasing hormone receptor, partial [Haliaeetus albicilla]